MIERYAHRPLQYFMDGKGILLLSCGLSLNAYDAGSDVFLVVFMRLALAIFEFTKNALRPGAGN